MKRFLIFIISLVTFNLLQAQEEYPDFTGGSDEVFPFYQEIQKREKKHIPTLLENKIWKALLPEDKEYSSEMEFRSGTWTSSFFYEGQKKRLTISYRICGDTICTYEDGKRYNILELTDSTLVILYLPERLTIGVGAVKYINTINSPVKMRENEDRLDSIWRKEDIWIKGVSLITNEPGKDTICLEAPQWANWKNLEDYFIAHMQYPAHLLKKNLTGYSVAMFTLDTLGLPRHINILTTIHKDFDKEVIRLIEELPHCLPCRNKNGKRIECLYTVYVPFLPQHYRDRIKADSIAKEELKESFVEWETPSYFQDGNPYAVTNYINKRLIYNPKLLGNQKQSKGIYTININSYGEVTESKTLRSCGIPEWDVQVREIIKDMPRWTPTINHYGKGEYRDSYWTVSVVFKNDSLTTPNKFVNAPRDYAWLIKTLSKSKYPIKLQKKNQEGMLRVAYEVDNNGYIINPRILCCTNGKFKKTTLHAFKAVIDVPTTLQAGKDTLLFQYKLDISPIHPHTDVLIIGYSSCEKPVLMRYESLLVAHTHEKHLEAGVPVCYLNERGDTVIPYGKYKFCQTDTIRSIGFVYENKSDTRIVCIDTNGHKLFNVFKQDNGVDYVREGLFRIINDKGLIGFADTLGSVVIQPQFKFAFPFENGKAKATFSGESKKVPNSNGEKHYWDSEEWFYINKYGQRSSNQIN